MPTSSKNQFLSFALSFLDSNSESMTELMEKAIAAFSVLELKKNDYFVKENEVCHYFCYVESGILQHSIMVEGEEKTSYLALKNSVTSSLNSFLFQKPSRKNIKAIVETKLWVVDLKTFKDLIANNDAFHLFYYNLIEKQICLIDDYRIDLLTLTPEERYKKLLVNEPKLLQEVPLHYLASFLGISNRHMSRIRRNTL
ncbi:Crp/Fnr family transcriptional regulator [Flavobacterium sp.]